MGCTSAALLRERERVAVNRGKDLLHAQLLREKDICSVGCPTNPESPRLSLSQAIQFELDDPTSASTTHGPAWFSSAADKPTGRARGVGRAPLCSCPGTGPPRPRTARN